MMTLEEGLINTCLLPRFSALNMLLRASLSTLMRTMVPGGAADEATEHQGHMVVRSRLDVKGLKSLKSI